MLQSVCEPVRGRRLYDCQDIVFVSCVIVCMFVIVHVLDSIRDRDRVCTAGGSLVVVGVALDVEAATAGTGRE